MLKNSRVTAQSQDDDEIAAGNNLITSENDASSSSVDNALRQRRNVTFRDGVNPGSDVSPVTNSSENQKSVLQSRKVYILNINDKWIHFFHRIIEEHPIERKKSVRMKNTPCSIRLTTQVLHNAAFIAKTFLYEYESCLRTLTL